MVWEWPRNNGGWHLPEVKQFWARLAQNDKFHVALVDGCAYGLRDSKNELLKKPWKLNCTSSKMATSLTRRCSGDHAHGECLGGTEARNSGFFPSRCAVLFRS